MTAKQLQTGISDSTRRSASIWLGLCLIMVALMVIIGGLTRLTDSGLSIVEWKPVVGVLPPLGDEAFAKEFEEYKGTPQFKKSFPDMTLVEFEHIYWLEYIHRLAGRVTGALFVLPLLWFAAKRLLPWQNIIKLSAIFALGGVQGVIGWYMVKSGLVDDPQVSPLRLAMHLGIGFALFGLILWQTLSFSYPRTHTEGFVLPKPPQVLKVLACLVTALIFLQVILGGLVAGLHAGLTYNTFPLMDGQWIPEGLWSLDPWYKNLFEEPVTVQFMHRIMAYGLSVAIPLYWLVGRNNPHVAHLLPILFSIFVVQFLLGVLTLLFVVPVSLASLHQANALLLFAIAVTIKHRLFIPLTSIDYETGNKPAHA